MTAIILAVVSQKGGSGKSSVAMGTGGEMGNRGHRVLVVDGDAQETSVAWARTALDSKPFPAAVVGMASYAGKMHREIQRQVENYDYIIIDCPPSVDAITPQSALLIADWAIVPVPMSPADLWATQGTKVLIERIQVINTNLKAVLVANKVQRTSLSNAVMEELGHFGIPLLRSGLSYRIAYQEAILAGTTVSALGRSARAAAVEMSALVDEILEVIGGQHD